MYKKLFARELFENLTCDELVVKINSGETKRKLGLNSQTQNWALL